MKKQILPLLLALLLLLTGCNGALPSVESEEITTEAADVPSEHCPISGTTHCDNENDGYCDLCRAYVVVVLDLYAINDLHGKFSDGENHIGVDEMSTYLKTARAEDDISLLLSVGDMWQGSAESNNTDGMIVTEWMNALDFDAMTLGNHEYDWGEDVIEANLALAEFPFLAINIYEKATDLPVSYCQPSRLIDKGVVQIGVIGAIGDCYSSISGDKTQDIYFKTGSELTALVRAEAQRLREAGADYIVYLLHDGNGDSRYGGVGSVSGAEMASYYDMTLSDGSVDLVFEGHTHQHYVLKDRYDVHHLHGGGENKGLSHVEVALNIANGQSTINTAEFIAADTYKDLADDPVVRELTDKYAPQIQDALRVVGYNAALRNSTVLRNLVAELYYEAGTAYFGDRYDVVLGGGFISVRSPWELSAGEVTYATLQSIFPFDNDLVLCSIRGSDLISRFLTTSNSNYFIYCGSQSTAEVIQSIDPAATYYILTDTYCSSYAPNRLTVVEAYPTGIYARDLLADYIQNGGLAD